MHPLAVFVILHILYVTGEEIDFKRYASTVTTFGLSGKEQIEYHYLSRQTREKFPEDVSVPNLEENLVYFRKFKFNIGENKQAKNWMMFGDVSVFIIDWRDYADSEYITTARTRVQTAGRILAKFIEFVMTDICLVTDTEEKSKFLQKIYIAGISLGAHTAGWTGHFIKTWTGHPISTIYGLDPAGYKFSDADKPKPSDGQTAKKTFRLHKDDASFVQVMHTSKSTLGGTKLVIGHADYYFDGANAQVGCSDTDCDHNKALIFFYDSMKKGIFGRLVLETDAHGLLVKAKSDKRDRYGIHMGRGKASTEGIFYVSVSRIFPFYGNSGYILRMKPPACSFKLVQSSTPSEKTYELTFAPESGKERRSALSKIVAHFFNLFNRWSATEPTQ